MSAVPAELRLHTPWRQALPSLLLLIAATLWIYRDTAAAMVTIWWRSDTFAHAFLVPPIAIWLIWRQRDRLALLTPRPQPWLLLPLLAVGALWLAGELVAVNAATQFALVATLVLAVPAVLGLEVASTVLFPLAFLFFAVPIGEFLMPALMESTADFTVYALRLTGIPVFREGRQFIIPTGSWSVVEACSGVRYLIASFMVGTLFAYLNYRSNRRRLIFMGVAIAVPVVANWLRAYMIVMLGHLSGNKLAVGADHLIYGWLFFGVVVMAMYFIGARWSEPDDARPVAPRALGRGTEARTAPSTAPAAVATTALLVAVIVSLPSAVFHWVQRSEALAADPQVRLPADLAAPWRSAGAQIVSWKPRFENASAEAAQAYTDGARTVGVYLAYYRGQGPERKLVGSQNVLVVSKDTLWNQVATGSRSLSRGADALAVGTADILGAATPGSLRRPHLSVWHWYWIDGRWVSSDAAAKLLAAFARLLGRGDDGAALILFTDDDSTAAAAATLEDFTQANLAALDALLRQVRDRR